MPRDHASPGERRRQLHRRTAKTPGWTASGEPLASGRLNRRGCLHQALHLTAASIRSGVAPTLGSG